ncbi:MAG TPA: cytidine deaminase [Candidatus Nitrosotenuis sp.]|nr:cytidine deaminase [Candidatus Nitrosotenuis sp.]
MSRRTGTLPESELLTEIHRFQTSGLVGLQTATAAAIAATAHPLAYMFRSQSILTPHLRRLLGPRTFVPAGLARRLARSLELSLDLLMLELVLVAREHARAPLSGYCVGAVARGRSGDLYLGFNLEFPGAPLSLTVHAEQALVAAALGRGETALRAVAVPHPPSGFGRQVLMELVGGPNLMVLTPGRRGLRLKTLLPESFGPEALGVEGGLLGHPRHPLQLSPGSSDPAVQAACEAAARSYAPYSGCPSGVALVTREGRIYTGCYAENAAFNPSLCPLRAALVHLVGDGRDYADIARAVLVEGRSGKVEQEGVTRLLLGCLAPGCPLEVHHVQTK